MTLLRKVSKNLILNQFLLIKQKTSKRARKGSVLIMKENLPDQKTRNTRSQKKKRINFQLRIRKLQRGEALNPVENADPAWPVTAAVASFV